MKTISFEEEKEKMASHSAQSLGWLLLCLVSASSVSLALATHSMKAPTRR